MPYIKEKDKVCLEIGANTAGELNYIFSQHINDYIHLKGLSYETLNAVVGALECQKIELYQRIILPYELKKIIENGDVYTINV
jgi:hypothetical protein